MIGYVTLGTNNLDKAAEFYDAVLGVIGAKRFMSDEGKFIAWAVAPEQPGIAASVPFDGNKATAGNGTMVAIAVDAKEKVDAVYKKAIEMGGTDEGAPGQRMEGFYAGYFRDRDGNKLNAFCMK